MGQKKRRLAFVIPDLNTWDGQSRSTLEIARRISKILPVSLYSFSLNYSSIVLRSGEAYWGDMEYHRITPDPGRPYAFRCSLFAWRSYLLSYLRPRRKYGTSMILEPPPLIHATGACTWMSDIVQVQFVQAAWFKKRVELGQVLQTKNWLKGKLNGFYQWALIRGHIFTENKAFQKNKTFIPIANCVAKELSFHYGIKNNVHVIHHGVDPTAFSPLPLDQINLRIDLRKKTGISPNDIVLLLVGAFARKGLSFAIQAMSHLDREVLKGVKLLAIGTGDVDGFRHQANSLQLEEKVILLGHQKNIVPYFQCADLFLFPTLYEPFGMVILEAMSCGLPPIVSAIAGGAELVENGKSGLIIQNPMDPKEIASHIEELVCDPQRRHKMGREARMVAEKRSWDQVASEYLRVIEPLYFRSTQSANTAHAS